MRAPVLTAKLKISASTSPLGKRLSFVSMSDSREAGFDQVLLVLAVHDGEVGAKPRPRGWRRRMRLPME